MLVGFCDLYIGDCLTHVANNKSLKISKAAAGDCVHRFCDAMVLHMKEFIHFPGTNNEVKKTIEDFYDIRGIHISYNNAPLIYAVACYPYFVSSKCLLFT